jgi:hypothetical protein
LGCETTIQIQEEKGEDQGKEEFFVASARV